MIKGRRGVQAACLVLAASLIPTYSAAQTPQLPTVTYQDSDPPEIITRQMRLRAIVLDSNSKASAEAARRVILPHVRSCAPVQEHADIAEFVVVCVAKAATDFPALGRVLAQFAATDGSEAIGHEIHLSDPRFPDAAATRVRFEEIAELRPQPARTRLDLVGGAYLEGVGIVSRPREGVPGGASYGISITPNYEWTGMPAACEVYAQPTEAQTDAAFRTFFAKIVQDLRARGFAMTSQGDTVSPVWKSTSAIGQSVRNGQIVQGYIRLIYWSRGGKYSGLSLFCELTVDPAKRKVAELVEKRLQVVHSEVDR